MGKNDKQDIYNTAMGKVGQVDTDYNKLSSTIGDRSDTTWNRATDDYNQAYSGYSNYAQGGGLTQPDIDRMRAAYGNLSKAASAVGGAGGWGGITSGLAGKSSNYAGLSSAYANAYRPDYSEADTGFRSLASDTGGFNTDQLNQIYGNVGQLTDIGKTGGITDEDKANILRQSMLDQEKTGGYTDQDKALIRAKSAASAPAYFGALKDNLQRQRAATGNLANAGAVDFKTARQAAQQQAADRISSEIGLAESIRQGRQAAATQLSGAGLSLAGLRTANEMAAARSAGDLGLSTQQAITANKLQGLQGLQTSQTGLGQWGLGQAGGLDQFSLSKAGGLDQFLENQASLDMQAQIANAQGAAAGRSAAAGYGYDAASQQADFEKWLTEYGNTQKQYGIGGLTDLYNTNLGASQNYTGMGLQALGGKYGAEGNMLGIATQNRGRTAMENLGTIGGLVGSVGGTLLGLGGGGGNSKTQVMPQTSYGSPIYG